jgi:hypothetical protein
VTVQRIDNEIINRHCTLCAIERPEKMGRRFIALALSFLAIKSIIPQGNLATVRLID